MVAAEMLRKRGHRVEVAKDGAEAVAAAAAERFAVVLMDCHMPIMDGYEATRAIRAAEGEGARTAIVAMTSDTVDSVRDACFEAGMDDYLAKPVTGEDAERGDRALAAGEPRSPTSTSASCRSRLSRATTERELIPTSPGCSARTPTASSRRSPTRCATATPRPSPAPPTRSRARAASSAPRAPRRSPPQLQAVAETGELGSAKALLRRLETAVDAAQSALSTALPEENGSK